MHPRRFTPSRPRSTTWLPLLIGLLLAAGCQWVGDRESRPDSLSTATLEVDGAVSSDTPEATRAGLDILARGGNAVDAAVAVSLVLGVTEPSESGLGGAVAMLVLPHGGEATLIDSDPSVATGDSSVAYPGALRVLHHAWSRYGSGRVSWEEVVEPAVKAADDGYPLLRFSHHAIVLEYERIITDAGATRMFLAPDHSIPAEGTRVANPELARVLREIGSKGPDAFYAGEIAQRLATERQVSPPSTSTPRESPALHVSYRDRVIWTAPEPYAGPFLAATLDFLTLAPKAWIQSPGASRTAWIAEALAYASGGGGAHPVEWVSQMPPMPAPGSLPTHADSGFVFEPPKDTASAKTRGGHKKPALPGIGSGALVRGRRGASTHLSVVDGDGNAVAVTQTLGTAFGSGLVGPLGFFLQANLGPQSRPPLVPTIVTRNGEVELVLGSAGERGVAAVLQVLQGVIDLQEPLEDAVLAPRLSVSAPGHQGRGRVFLEGLVWEDPLPTPDAPHQVWGETDELVLRQRGFTIGEQPGGPWPAQMDPWFGGVNAIARSSDGWTAIGDDRRDGVGGVLTKGAPSLQRTDRPVNEAKPAPERRPWRGPQGKSHKTR